MRDSHCGFCGAPFESERWRLLRAAVMRWALALVLAGCGARSGLTVEPTDGALDGGLDAARDAGNDAAPVDCLSDAECDDGLECTTDRCAGDRCEWTPDHASCDDGLFCDGNETCDLRIGCRSSGPPCGDGVECTEDRCVEATDACVAVPDASRCPISHRCDPVRGCLARALVHDAMRLYEVDLPDGTVTPGPAVTGLTDVALHPDGTLYAVDAGSLLRIDPGSGVVEPILPISMFVVALEVGPDGALYAAGEQSVLRIDVTTFRQTTFGRLPSNRWVSGDIAFIRGTLMVTARRDRFGTTVDELIAIEPAGPRLIGPTGQECIWGLAPFGDTLYGFTCRGRLLLIDAATGSARDIADLGGLEVGGAAAR